MAKKLGTTKLTDNVLVTAANLATEVTGTLGVANGGTGQSVYTDGQLLIGNTSGNTLTKATLTQGSGITITNGGGSITIAATGGGTPADGYTYIVKPSSQDVTNASLTNDTDFNFAITAANRYSVLMNLIIGGNDTAGDYTMDFQVSAGTMKGVGSVQTVDGTPSASNQAITANAAANTGAVATGVPTADLDRLIAVRVQYAFTASATGTFRFRFGNNATGAGRVSRTYKGSVMAWKNIT
jgi:hypothetical protein